MSPENGRVEIWRGGPRAPFPDPAHQTGHAVFPASGFRTRGGGCFRPPRTPTRRILVRLGISGLLDRLNASLRLLGFSPIARALGPSDLTLEPRPLGSTIVTRFTATLWASPTSTLARLGSSRTASCASFRPRTGMDLPC